jgi:regulator of sigma E protease
MVWMLIAISPVTIFGIVQKLFWFVIVLGILVTFHEFGHFLMARWVGVRVLRFSLGFGPKLAGRQFGETEFVVSAIPLGGYVKLFGEEACDITSPEERRWSFSHQNLWSKILIVFGGPGFNFLLAYLIFAGWLATGAPLFVPSFKDLTPDIEAIKPGSPADLAGIKPGDRVLRVNDKEIATRSELYNAIAKSNGMSLTLELRRGQEVKIVTVSPVATTVPEDGQEVTVYTLGIEETAPVIAAVMNGFPAQAAGIKEGDRVVAIDGQPIYTWSQMTAIVKENPNRPLRFEIDRNGHIMTLFVTPVPEKVLLDGRPVEIGKIGVSGPGRFMIRSSTPLAAIWQGLQATWSWTKLTVVGIYKMVAGDISSKSLGGPLTIANLSGEAGAQGVSNVIHLIAILSINLAVLNLLPIPILDGGHLLFFAIEAILRKPLDGRQRELAQQVGLLLLVCIMVYAFWNDLERLLHP